MFVPEKNMEFLPQNMGTGSLENGFSSLKTVTYCDKSLDALWKRPSRSWESPFLAELIRTFRFPRLLAVWSDLKCDKIALNRGGLPTPSGSCSMKISVTLEIIQKLTGEKLLCEWLESEQWLKQLNETWGWRTYGKLQDFPPFFWYPNGAMIKCYMRQFLLNS